MRFDPKQWKSAMPYPPLGTLYAASLLRESGYEVFFHDVMFAKDPEEIIVSLKKHEPDILVIYDDGFNYLTKMCLTNMREAAFKMSKLASEQGCQVIISSSDSTDQFEKYIHEGADFILIGEAEMTLFELISSLKDENEFSKIQGLAFKKDDCIVKTPRRAVIKDLDSLPLPAWDLLDIEPYRELWLKNAGYFSINIGTTRGCPFKCNWCAKPIYGNRYNSRSPQNVITELKWLKELYQFDHVWFCDDIFGLKPGWVKEFADLVEKENLQFKYKIQARADLLLQENYIRDLARSGCDNIWMGAESGSQKILDDMEKGTTVEQISGATHLIRKYGMKPSFFIQFGYLGETKEDIRKTIEMINRLLPHEIGISVSYPLPGTGFYEKVKQDLHHKTNWTDSDEMALMFRNTYQPAYYKQLYSYVHRSYRMHVAKDIIRQILLNPSRAKREKIRKALSYFYYLPTSIIDRWKLRSLEKPA